MCHGQKSLYWGWSSNHIQPLIGNPYSGYINPYYWVDDHPLLYGNNGSLDPSTHGIVVFHPAIGLGTHLRTKGLFFFLPHRFHLFLSKFFSKGFKMTEKSDEKTSESEISYSNLSLLGCPTCHYWELLGCPAGTS